MCYIYHGPEVYTTNQPSVFSWLPFLSSDGSNPLAALGFTFGESIETYSTAFRKFRLQQPIAQQLSPIFSGTVLATQNGGHSNAFTVTINIKSRAYKPEVFEKISPEGDIFMARTRRAIPMIAFHGV